MKTLLALLPLALSLPAAPAIPQPPSHQAPQEPFAVLPNRGQWPAEVAAGVRHGAMTSWLTETGMTTRVVVAEDPPDARGALGPEARLPVARMATVNLELVGGAAGRPQFEGKLPGVFAFFVGNDRAKWAESVPRFASATRTDVWPGIDLVLGTRDGALAYDLHFAPGADVAAARLRFSGAERVWIDANGALALDLGIGVLRHSAPVAWQVGHGGMRNVLPAHFVLHGDGTVSFSVAGREPTLQLVIDPSLLWSAALGGAGNDGLGLRQAIDRDAAGNVVACGYTGSWNFPGGSPQGVWDGFVTAFDGNGGMTWSAVIGGTTPAEEWLRACCFDGAGGVYFGGGSSDSTFPTINPWQLTNRGPLGPGVWGDMVVGQLTATATGVSLTWSTFLGDAGQELINGISVVPSGVAVTGWSNSPVLPVHAPVLPVHPGAAQSARAGGYDGYAAVFSATGQFVYGTWWGGSTNDDVPACLKQDPSGLLVIGGYTASTNWPTTPNNAAQPGPQGGIDGCVVCFDPTLSVPVYASYLGGPGYDAASDLAIDASGRWAIGSWTNSVFPAPLTIPPSAFQPLPPGGVYDGYVMLLDWRLPPAQQLLWGTYLGGNFEDGINGVAIDGAGRVTVTGSVETLVGTASTSFPVTAWCQQPVPTNGPGGTAGHHDAFVARFDPRRSGSDQLVYSTFLGGTGTDYGYDLVLDERARPIVAGVTTSVMFPGSVSTNGGQDVFLAHLDLLATVADRFGAA
ncbi:MAG: hypothetical protein H6838_20730, partial [Planctomycetes bacterium]|nr:hypothetical protein [Planctomycetota bacterium]